MELYKFFNSTAEDPRTYQATDFADYFGSVLSTGLLHTDNVPGMRARVIPGTLRTSVTAGKAIMEGHLYENTSTLELTHDLPETTADRIDRVVLRLNLENSERNIKLHVIKGTPSGNPAAPTLRRDNFVYEISLARVLVRANTVQLLPDDLHDERLNADVGGLVSSLISIPVDQFQDQWDELMEGIQSTGFTPAATFQEHVNSGSAHGIGDKSLLRTTDKSTLVGAINEAFQSASNGKISIKNAVAGIDSTVIIPENPTFQQLATAISGISTGFNLVPGTANIIATITSRYVREPVYTTVLAAKINANGKVRTNFQMYRNISSGGNIMYGRIFVNNQPVGIERILLPNDSGGRQVTFTEDIAVNKNDVLEFRFKASYSTTDTYFQIYDVYIGIAQSLVDIV